MRTEEEIKAQLNDLRKHAVYDNIVPNESSFSDFLIFCCSGFLSEKFGDPTLLLETTGNLRAVWHSSKIEIAINFDGLKRGSMRWRVITP